MYSIFKLNRRIYQGHASLWQAAYYSLRKENVKAYILSRDTFPPMKGHLTVVCKKIAKTIKLDIDFKLGHFQKHTFTSIYLLVFRYRNLNFGCF